MDNKQIYLINGIETKKEYFEDVFCKHLNYHLKQQLHNISAIEKKTISDIEKENLIMEILSEPYKLTSYLKRKLDEIYNLEQFLIGDTLYQTYKSFHVKNKKELIGFTKKLAISEAEMKNAKMCLDLIQLLSDKQLIKYTLEEQLFIKGLNGYYYSKYSLRQQDADAIKKAQKKKRSVNPVFDILYMIKTNPI